MSAAELGPATVAPPHDAEPPSVSRSTPSPAPGGGRTVALLRHAGLPLVIAVSAILNLVHISQNGYANIFYSAGVKSMLHSWHNFLFVSFDPGGLISVDKPPLALWLQAASAELFGFHPLSLLLPEAIAGVLAVALMYLLLNRRLGPLVAFAGALALAVFPSFVAVSRDNGVDPLLILLMVLACELGLRACESGRWRWLLSCALVVGLAFNTKTLAAYLVVPGIAFAYLLCAPGSPLRRVGRLAVAGLVMVVVSFAWIAYVDSVPASQRPYVGSSTNNSELGLTFEYNGVGRVGGQSGGPGQTVVRPGAYVPLARQQLINEGPRRALPHGAPARSAGASTGAAGASPAGHGSTPPSALAATGGPAGSSSLDRLDRGRERNPIPFGGPPGPLRLFHAGLGDQGGWMLPFALFGLVALALAIALGALRTVPGQARRDGGRTGRDDPAAAAGRRDPRLATVIVLGGWFLVEAAVLSLSSGIVHPYYVSALGPGTAAMVGAGAVALLALVRGRGRPWGLALAALAITGTVAVQVVLLHREHYMEWFVPVLVIGAAAGLLALLARRRLAAPALAGTLLLLLIAPAAYATTTWLAPVEGTFPVAGPHHAPGDGGYGVNTRDLGIADALMGYVSSHRPGSRWAVLTVASDTSAPMILQGLDAGAIAGYSGTDPALDGRGLARLVADGEARYVILGGEYALRGGNGATRAVLRACRELKPSEWHSPVAYPFGLVLFDCAGDERALASAG